MAGGLMLVVLGFAVAERDWFRMAVFGASAAVDGWLFVALWRGDARRARS
jgi:hypothetical protein